MARKQVSKGLDQQTSPQIRPRLVVTGSSTLDGRGATLMRIRPSLLEELNTYAVGPLYLLVDVAIQRLVAELRERPESQQPTFIEAETMDPSVYDRALLQESGSVPKPRVSKKALKAAAAEAAADDAGAVSSGVAES